MRPAAMSAMACSIGAMCGATCEATLPRAKFAARGEVALAEAVGAGLPWGEEA
jgi:hypothetical protein